MADIIPRLFNYRFAYRGWLNTDSIFNLTFSVTNRCQSRCKTCRIWKVYRKDPDKRKNELTLGEIGKIFASLGHVPIFNISGGEPFLREDLVEIVRLSCKYLSPKVIHIPTNALAANRVEKQVREILEFLTIDKRNIQLTIKPSLDHIGEKHDAIRGVPGNFEKVIDAFHRLKQLKRSYRNFHVELGTVISTWNVVDIKEISAYVSSIGADSYRNEIAEQRSEMFNMGEAITPSAELYEDAIKGFVQQTRGNMRSRSLFQRINNAFRLVYYDYAIGVLKKKKQILPCYAGISNIHLSAYADVWPCCTLGYDKSMGNLRDYAYDLRALFKSEQAREVRNYVRSGECHCPLANQAYSNILMHAPSLARVMLEMIRT